MNKKNRGVLMMALLFLIFVVCFYLIFLGKRKEAFILATINIVFCFLMLIHHATSTLGIRL
jgi:Family of unknown function (DUF5993)